eukprot:2320894-Rhodomonas_salina.1
MQGQDSPAVSISAEGVTGGIYDIGDNILRTPMDKDVTTILERIKGAVAGDAAPLRVQNPAFLVKTIGQSTAWPCDGCGAPNFIIVTISANVALSGIASSTVTLAGLVGSQTPDAGGTTLLLQDMAADAEVLLLSDASSTLTSREGVRFYISEQQLVNSWHSSATEFTATVYLSRNNIYDIKLEYKEMSGQARARLFWQSDPSMDFQIVPSEQLYHSPEIYAGPWSLIACGDRLVRLGSETCDDGNTNSRDGCSSSCAVESGWVCTPTGTTPPDPSFSALSSCIALCGDGRRIGPQNGGAESCDDANAVGGDGCSASCTVESGYICSGGTPNSRDVCRVLTPTFSADNGTSHADYLTLTVQTSTGAATVFAVTDGSEVTGLAAFAGTAGSSSLEITVSVSPTQVTAYATRPDLLDSFSFQSTFFIFVGGNIAFFPPAGNYSSAQSVSIYHCYDFGPNLAENDVESKPDVVGAMIGDAAPLLVYDPGFLLRKIGQSTTVPGALNALTITLVPTAALDGSDSAAVVISGLTGTQTATAGGTTSLNPLAAADTALTVSSSTSLGTGPGGYIEIDSEYMAVTSISGNALSVSRGQARSALADHGEGTVVTALDMTELSQGLNESDTSALVASATVPKISTGSFVRIDA